MAVTRKAKAIVKKAKGKLTFSHWLDLKIGRWAVFKHSKIGIYMRSPVTKQVVTGPTEIEAIMEILYNSSSSSFESSPIY